MSRFTTKMKMALGATGIAAASLLSAAPASAAPPSYSHVVATHSFQSMYSPVGGYIDCPPGMLAIASGAVSSDLRANLLTSITTPAHTGAFASAYGLPGEVLQVKAQCVAASKLSGTTTASKRIREHRTGGQYYVEKVTCPTGTVAYGGGGTVYNGPYYDVQGLYTYASKPDGASWTYAGWGDISATGKSLGVEAHCLPRARFGKIVTVEQTALSPATGFMPVFVGARCPAGFTAFAGGAWYHYLGSTIPSRLGKLRVSEMTSDDRGWFAGGDAYGVGIALTTKVRCTDRLG